MIASDRIRISTQRPTEFVDLTSRLQRAVEKAGLQDGRIHLQSLHTTLGLTVNENEQLLLADLEALLKRLAPDEATYLHDDFSLRSNAPDNEPVNGHAHARNLLLQPSLTVLVEGGELLLGSWQAIFAVELDGPRTREIALQLEGSFGRQPVNGPRRLIELELERQLHPDPASVGDPMRRLVEAGGKRIRPYLALLTSRLGPEHDPLRAATLAAAVELIHAATLVHDDYVDESPRRRGRPTVAAAEGPARAVAVGDYYFAKATRLIAELGNADVTSTIAMAMEAICRSQIDDLELRGRYPGDEEAYLRVVRGKTAALIAASCAAGAQLSGASPEVLERVRRYGEAIGIAFQMTDDVVDFSERSGKPLGQDIRERVLSLPLIYAIENAEVGAEIEGLLVGELPDEQLRLVVELVDRSGALERVNRQAQDLVQLAIRELDGVDLDGVKSTLVEIAESVVDRHA
ncbi:MAG TPA: secondary thiamine-phosphate synthase enzyme YjbQ [Candidatus Dormibacteraeota bacterium]|nr:secondary thiamine-phosphate synthase enzyme YjbQ [Candidatus Dormibacteraeota bacterium]